MKRKKKTGLRDRFKRAAVPVMWAVIPAAVVVLSACCCRLLACADMFRLTTFSVNGCSRYTEEDIIEKSGLQFGSSLFTVNIGAASRRIEQNPWIYSAAVRRRFPCTVEIEVIERIPVARIMLDGLYLVDSRGEIFCKAAKPDMRLPLIKGSAVSLLADACKLLDAMCVTELFAGKNTTLLLDPAMGINVCGLAIEGKVCFGFDHFEEKVARLKSIIDDIQKKNMQVDTVLLHSRHIAYVKPVFSPAGGQTIKDKLL